MQSRVPTIFEVAEAAARQLKKSQPQSGSHHVAPARKTSARTSRPAPKRKPPRKRKS
jgi:hypothetical protein